jgi:hypothetical protein
MRCLDIVWVVVSPSPSHTLGIFVVWDDIVVVHELFVADCAFPVLFDSLPVKQFSHFCSGPEFPISSRVMRILNTLNSQTHSTFLASSVTATAED